MKQRRKISRILHGVVVMIFTWSLMSVIYHHADAYPHYHLKASAVVATVSGDRDNDDAVSDIEPGIGLLPSPALDLHSPYQNRSHRDPLTVVRLSVLRGISINAP